jgi:hypothetical protein
MSGNYHQEHLSILAGGTMGKSKFPAWKETYAHGTASGEWADMPGGKGR